jgi:hypothetical protein
MGRMKWVGIVGVVVAGLMATGCASNPPQFDGKQREPEERMLPKAVSRGVVQVQRQRIDANRMLFEEPITVAYMMSDPTNLSRQWWLSIEPLPIEPVLLTLGYEGLVILSPDDTHRCSGVDTFRSHLELEHADWISTHAASLRFYYVQQASTIQAWPGD